MKIARVGEVGQEKPAVIQADRAILVDSLIGDWSRSEIELGAVAKVQDADLTGLPSVPLSTVRIGAPILNPTKVICVGLNYLAHIKETNAVTPIEPVIFMKAPDSVVGPNDDVVIPPGSTATDYEVELAIIIGKKALYLASPGQAQEHVLGYTISQDISERHWQLERSGQWVKGKSFPTFNPIGPWIVTKDEINPHNLRLWCSVDDEIRQDSNTNDLLFGIDHVIWYISQFMELQPGDIINTGTPFGVGLGFNPPKYLKGGQRLTTGIENIGTISSRVVDYAQPMTPSPMFKDVWVAGEVLIDLITQGGETNAIVGGGPANTSVALARLGINTFFIDGMSTDAYGQRAKIELEAAGVKLDYVEFSQKPMCLADVTLAPSGSATYKFLIDGTATFDFRSEWLPDPSGKEPAALYLGTLATLVEPGASVLFDWARDIGKVVPVVYDPNVRPSVVGDRVRYQTSVARWASISKVIKVSSDDMAWLYPAEDFEDVAKRWFGCGVELVVLTLGAEGLRARDHFGEVSVPGVKVDVVDTVGAGDTIGAILVEAIAKNGFESLHGDELAKVLVRAATAAAITCSHSGAQPPTQQELDNFKISLI